MSTNQTETSDPLLTYRERFIQASKEGDIDGIVALATDDVVVMSPNDSTIYGKAEWREWLEEYFRCFRLAAFTEPERSVTVQGDLAVECTTYMIAVGLVAAPGRIRDDGRFLTIWKKQADREWRISQMMWNSTNPIGIGTSRYMARVVHKSAGNP